VVVVKMKRDEAGGWGGGSVGVVDLRLECVGEERLVFCFVYRIFRL
jgi:hypothetical protein